MDNTNSPPVDKLLHPHSPSYVVIQIATIVCLAILAHFLVRLLQFISDWLIQKSAAKDPRSVMSSSNPSS